MQIDLDVSLDPTLGCGQAHRWTKVGDEWKGILDSKIVILKENNRGFEYSGTDRDGILRYFRSDDDLDTIYSEISIDPFISELVSKFHGMRILRQDHWECTATYLLATNANVKRIAKMVDSVCRTCGNDLGGAFSFPSPGDILDHRDEICGCGLGYRDNRLVGLAEMVENGELDLDAIEEMDYKDCVSSLKTVNGIGDKVADCIALFSYGHLQAVPVDARIERVMRETYGITGSYRNISDNARKMFGRYAGYAQEFLYHSGT